MTFDPDQIFTDAADKNANGTLTIEDTVMWGYYRILEGRHAGRVVIKTTHKVDGKSALYFANGLTWIHTERLNDVRCERAYPTFNAPMHNDIDRSEATWYNDGSNEPSGHVW